MVELSEATVVVDMVGAQKDELGLLAKPVTPV